MPFQSNSPKVTTMLGGSPEPLSLKDVRAPNSPLRTTDPALRTVQTTQLLSPRLARAQQFQASVRSRFGQTKAPTRSDQAFLDNANAQPKRNPIRNALALLGVKQIFDQLLASPTGADGTNQEEATPKTASKPQ